VPDELPPTPYDAFFHPDYKLHPPLTGRVDNLNTRASLERIRISIREKLRFMNGAPSVQMQEIPPDLMGWLEAEERNAEEKEEEEKRGKAGGKAVGDERKKDGHRARNEFFDGEKDGERDRDMVGGGGVAKGSGRGGKPTLGGGGGGNGIVSGKGKGKGKGKAGLANEA
jgi:histone deacetylase HOS2